MDTRDDGLLGAWFDGQTSQRRPVRLRIDGDALELAPDDAGLAPRRYALASLAPGERSPGAPLPLALPDGGTLWLDDTAAKPLAALLTRLQPNSHVTRLIASWPAVLACLACVVAFVVWFHRDGVGLVANTALRAVPLSVDQAVGIQAMQAIEKRWFAPTQLPLERRRALEARFAEQAARLAPDLIVRVVWYREKDEAGFNAMALPHGLLIVLDGLAESLDDDELMFVLGHEMGHVVHRHGMRAVARSLGLFVVAGVVFGDFSTVAAAAIASVQGFAYSRDAELEADAYARRFIAAAGLPPTLPAAVWRKFSDEEQRRGAQGLPAWLSTHPSTEERLGAGQRP